MNDAQWGGVIAIILLAVGFILGSGVEKTFLSEKPQSENCTQSLPVSAACVNYTPQDCTIADGLTCIELNFNVGRT